MSKKAESLTLEILRQIRDELRALNGRVDGLTEETRNGFMRMRQEFHGEVVGQRRFVESRLSLIERRLARLESKK
jgi:hypothetical protein